MILIKGKSAADKKWVERIKDRIISMQYEQIDGGHDKFSLVVDNHDRALLDKDEAGISVRTVIVQWGRIGDLTRPREINFNKVKGFKKLTYMGSGGFWKADLTKKNPLWKGMSHYEIVRKVAKNMGYTSPDVQDPGIKLATVKQFETDMQFLIRLGKEVGYACWVDEDGLHWKERDMAQAPVLKIVYGGKTTDDEGYGILIGEPNVEFGWSRDIPKKSTAMSQEQIEKIKIAQGGGVQRNIDGKLVLLKEAPAVKRHSVGDDESSAKKESYAEMCQINPADSEDTKYAPAGKSYVIVNQQKLSHKKVKVSLKIYGKPHLKKGQNVELLGFAGLVDGKYYVKKMTDNCAGEHYTQDLELRRGSAPNRSKDAKRVQGKVNPQRDVCGGSKSGKKKMQEIPVRTALNMIETAHRRVSSDD